MKPADPRSAQDPLVGLVLAGCRLEAVLGRGGMGAVYRAHHAALDKAVAVKILAPHLAGDKDYVERFIQEARAAAKIDHPNVVHVLDVGQESEQHFIIMQFVEGESLEDILDRNGRLDLKLATRIARDVAAGLEALHAAGIVHRDIKPANILVARDGSVKITDFGLARNLRQQRGLTVAGVFMGTPEYVSPEQVTDENVDHRTDLYSLGIAYYQMLSGELPFSGQSAVEVASAHINQPCPPIESKAPNLDPRATAVVHRLLEKKPEARIQSAAILKAELDEIAAGAARSAPPRAASPPPPAPEIPIRGRRAGPPPPPPPAAPPPAEEILVSAGPKKRPMPEGGEIVPRDFVVPPPPPKPKIPGPDEAPRPSTQVPPPPVLPGPVMRPKPVAAPPPPPVGRPAAAGRRRRREMGRQALFWFLVLGSWSLFFAAGALGTAARDPHSFLESLTRPFTYADGNLLTRIGATVLALVLLALAFFQNRRAIEDSYLPGPAIMLLIFAGLAIYAGALGLPVPEGTDGTVSRVLRGLRETWLHGVHLCPAAVWAVLTGFALGSHPAATRREFAAAGIHLAAGLAAAALFGALGSGGSIESLGRNLAQPLGAGVPALVALACAGLAVALAFGRRRPRPVRIVGVLLGLAAASGALLTGVRPPDGPPSLGALLQAPFAGFGTDFLAHGGLLTAGVLVGLWGAGVLYNRFIP